MIPLDHLLALAVLVAPGDGGSVCPREHVGVWKTIQAIALSLELIDPREVRYVLARASDFDPDVRLLRRRYSELGDAPPVTDAWALPPRELACQQLALNRDFHCTLTRRREAVGDYPGLDELLTESDRRYKIWDAVRDARSDFYYVSVRRAALALLQRMIGIESYNLAALPPPVPAGLAD